MRHRKRVLGVPSVLFSAKRAPPELRLLWSQLCVVHKATETQKDKHAIFDTADGARSRQRSRAWCLLDLTNSMLVMKASVRLSNCMYPSRYLLSPSTLSLSEYLYISVMTGEKRNIHKKLKERSEHLTLTTKSLFTTEILLDDVLNAHKNKRKKGDT